MRTVTANPKDTIFAELPALMDAAPQVRQQVPDLAGETLNDQELEAVAGGASATMYLKKSPKARPRSFHRLRYPICH